jgi:hypothetical protein
MSKKKQEILYDSEVENVEAEQVEQPITAEQPQNVQQVAPNLEQQKTLATKSKTIIKPDVKETFKCTYCEKCFARNYYLNRHIEDGRCTIKRNMDISREKQLKEIEDKINLKLQKKDMRVEKKLMKAISSAVKPVSQKQVQQPVKAVKEVKPVQQPVQQQARPRSGFIVNF